MLSFFSSWLHNNGLIEEVEVVGVPRGSVLVFVGLSKPLAREGGARP